MKTTLLFALTFGCIIPTYSQINLSRRTDAAPQQFSVSPSVKNDHFGNYKFVDKFSGSVKDGAWDGIAISPIGPKHSENRETYSGDNMPCFKPADIFSMRVYRPDSTVIYTMLLKKY